MFVNGATLNPAKIKKMKFYMATENFVSRVVNLSKKFLPFSGGAGAVEIGLISTKCGLLQLQRERLYHVSLPYQLSNLLLS